MAAAGGPCRRRRLSGSRRRRQGRWRRPPKAARGEAADGGRESDFSITAMQLPNTFTTARNCTELFISHEQAGLEA